MAEVALNVLIRAQSQEFRNLLGQMERLNMTAGKAGVSTTRAATGAATGFNRATTEANRFNKSLAETNHQGLLIGRVFEAFLVYKGFVFLKTQVEDFTRTLVDLEYQLALVKTQLSGETGGGLAKGIEGIAKNLGVSLTELAKAEYLIVSANISVADSYKVLDLSAKAAIAGGIGNIETAFNAALSQINAFGLATSDFERVYDLQFNLVKRGIFTYEQFANVVGNVSIAFARLGSTVEESNAAIAAISQVFTGPQLQQGATGLRNAVNQIVDNFQEFEAVGIDVVDEATGQFRSYISIIEQLADATAKMTPAEEGSFLKSLFPDQRELRGIQTAINTLPKLRQFYVEQLLSAGDLDNKYKGVNETLKAQALILKNNLVPAFQPFVNLVGDLVRGLNDLNRSLPGFSKNLLVASLAMGGLYAVGRFGPGLASPLLSTAGVRNQAFAMSLFGRGREALMAKQYGLSRAYMAGANVYGAMTTPLALGALAMGGSALYSYGQKSGSAVAGGLGGAMLGASIGSILGPWGIAGGAILGGLYGAIKKETPAIATTFSEAFTQELENRSGAVAEALMAALSRDITGANTSTSQTIKLGGNFWGGELGTKDQRAMLVEAVRNGATVTFTSNGVTIGGATFGQRTNSFGPGQESELQQYLNPPGYHVGRGNETATISQGAFAQVSQNYVRDFSSVLSSLVANSAELSMRSMAEGITPGEMRTRIINQSLSEYGTTLGSVYDQGEVSALRLFMKQMDAGAVQAAQWNEAFSIYKTQGAEAFVKFIGAFSELGGSADELGGELADLVIPATTSLADTLFNAAKVVRLGLIDSTHYTADQLEMLGEEFQALNKGIFKLNLLQEFQRLGEFIGLGKDYLRPTMEALLEDIKVGGQDLRTLLSDPKQLADLLTNIEFGDIQVDNSTNNNIVIRLSGGADMDTAKAADFADAILKELNNKTRKSLA